MEKIIHSLIDSWIKGVDTYTHNGSTWLIFTDNKQWVIELTEQKTLWYNYSFFKQIFEFTSLDVVDNQHYITKWVEDNIINVVKCTEPVEHTRNSMTKHLIKYGVKETMFNQGHKQLTVKKIIQNGVKETFNFDEKHALSYEQGVKKLVEDTIQNGVKETNWFEGSMLSVVDNVIDDGINHTEIGWHQCNNVDDVIEKGVIETKGDASQNPMGKVTKVIKNGVKKSIAAGYKDPNSGHLYVKWDFEINDVLENGVKETKTPGKDGDLFSTFQWMEENKTNSVPKMIDDVIENGVKETLVSGSWNNDKMDKVIENGKLVSGTFVGGKRQKEDVESVIGYGTKNPSV